MAEQARTGDLRRSDIDDLQDDLPVPSHQGSAGGSLATDIGSEDELEEAEGIGTGVTRVHGSDKVQPVPQRKTGHEPSSF